MAIYVDQLDDRGLWSKTAGSCHLASDVSETELKAFGRNMGLRDEWYQSHPVHPHYDLSRSQRDKAIKLGAISVSNLEFARKCSRMFNNAIGE